MRPNGVARFGAFSKEASVPLHERNKKARLKLGDTGCMVIGIWGNSHVVRVHRITARRFAGVRAIAAPKWGRFRFPVGRYGRAE